MKNVLGLIALLAVSAACTSGPIPIDLLDTKPEKPANGKTWWITDEACGYQLLDFIPIQTNDTMSRALRNVQYQARGQYIESVQIEQSWIYGLIGTVLCTRVSATAVMPVSNP